MANRTAIAQRRRSILRTLSLRPRSARWFACEFACGVRTIHRDIELARDHGVPVEYDHKKQAYRLNASPAEAQAILARIEARDPIAEFAAASSPPPPNLAGGAR